MLQNDRVVASSFFLKLNIHVDVPDQPYELSTEGNTQTSSSLFISWQPGYDGGRKQTFALTYCKNISNGRSDCNHVVNLNKNILTLTNLKAFTWYDLTLLATNEAGNSSEVRAKLSTAREYVNTIVAVAAVDSF